MSDGIERGKKVLKGDKVLQKNNLDMLLNRSITFRKSRKINDKLDKYRQKYAPINIAATAQGHTAVQANDGAGGFGHFHGPGAPFRSLFRKENLEMEWTDIRPIGAGLIDLGRSAMNCVLQSLTYTPVFTNFLLSRAHSSACSAQDHCFVCALEHHVRQSQRQSGKSISPRTFVAKLKKIDTEAMHDVCATWNYFMDQIQHFLLIDNEKADIKVQQTTALYHMFGGYLEQKTECLSCKTSDVNYEAFLSWNLDILAGSTVEKCISKFIKSRKSTMACKGCEEPVKFLGQNLCQPPKILVLGLNRFAKDTTKNDKMIKYDETLDLKRWITEDKESPSDETSYRLYAVITHTGSYHGGKYIVYVKSPSGTWYGLDNESIYMASTKRVLEQKASMLLYKQNIHTKAPTPSKLASHTDVLKTMREQEKSSTANVDTTMDDEVPANNLSDNEKQVEEEDEEDRALLRAMEKAGAKQKVESKHALIVAHDESKASKRSKMESFAQKSFLDHGRTNAKEQLLAKPAQSQYYDAVGHWDDEDVGSVVKGNTREKILKKLTPKRARYDARDIEYDQGRVKKVKNKNKASQFGQPNPFQQLADLDRKR